MTTDAASKRAKKRERSPNYPGIDLEDAVARARTLFEQSKRHPTPVNVALEHWGFKPNSGAGGVVVGALKAFGLVRDEGDGANRKVQLTDDAVAILIDERVDSPNRAVRLKEAALRPRIHREVWDEFKGELPHDTNLKYHLRSEKGFTDNGANEFIRQFRHTIGYAGLTESDRIREEGITDLNPRVDLIVRDTKDGVVAAAEYKAKPQIFNIPLGDNLAVMQIPVPMDEDAWDLMITVLSAMKAGIVRKKPEKPSSAAKSAEAPE